MCREELVPNLGYVDSMNSEQETLTSQSIQNLKVLGLWVLLLIIAHLTHLHSMWDFKLSNIANSSFASKMLYPQVPIMHSTSQRRCQLLGSLSRHIRESHYLTEETWIKWVSSHYQPIYKRPLHHLQPKTLRH